MAHGFGLAGALGAGAGLTSHADDTGQCCWTASVVWHAVKGADGGCYRSRRCMRRWCG